MKVFFDMEFTGLTKDTTAISLGVVTEDDERLYIEFPDYDYDQCTS